MKLTMMVKGYGAVYASTVKKQVADKKAMQDVKKEYYEIMRRAKDIGNSNTLLGSYTLGALFIALCRKDGHTPEENYRFLEKGLRESGLIRPFLGNAESYMSEKRMQARRAWSKQTHEHRYENDWVVDVIEKGDDFTFGLDYTECGVCKLFRDEGCSEWAHYLCKLDFMLVEVIGIHLKRTMTLADGAPKCDFRFQK